MTTSNSTAINNAANDAFVSVADFVPFLTLFGEEVTKQFLATSLGTADTFLLGIAPLGIITIIVSAVRVGGTAFMKSIIGRARDSPDDEEKEILSSTSSNVREIWNGHRVVRQTGESKTIAVVYDPKAIQAGSNSEPSGELLVRLYNDRRFAMRPMWATSSSSYNPMHWSGSKNKPETPQHLPDYIPPNLTFNTLHETPDPKRVMIVAILGSLVQAGVMAFNGLAVYFWQWPRSRTVVPPWAFPLWAAATIAISIGVWCCGWVVQSSTQREILIEDSSNRKLQIIFMQQKFDKENIPAYSIEPSVPSKGIIFPRRLWPPTSDIDSLMTQGFQKIQTGKRAVCVVVGTICALGGFVSQNIATRALHWSAGVSQLVTILVLTGLRAYLRRSIGRPINGKASTAVRDLKSGVETSDLITGLTGRSCHLAVGIQAGIFQHPIDQQRYGKVLDISTDLPLHSHPDSHSIIIEKILQAQSLLSQYEPEADCVKKAAANCTKAMDEILKLVAPGGNNSWSQLGNFMCLGITNPEMGKAAGETAPVVQSGLVYRFIGAPDDHGERFRLFEAVIRLTLHRYADALKPYQDRRLDFLVARILGYCTGQRLKRYLELLNAWIAPGSELAGLPIQKVDVSYIGSQPRGQPVSDLRDADLVLERAQVFGLPFSYAFRNTVTSSGPPQTSNSNSEPLELLWQDWPDLTSEHEREQLVDFLVLQITLDIMSSFMLQLTRTKLGYEGFRRYKSKQICQFLEEIIERNGIFPTKQHVRLVFVPALIKHHILNEGPDDDRPTIRLLRDKPARSTYPF